MEKRKIVVLDAYALCANELDYHALSELGDVTVYERTTPEQAIERIGDAEIILTNKVVITREIMEACPALRYVGVTATGFNIVDIEEAKRRGIVVTNAPAYSTQAVAQHTAALLLESLSHVAAYDEKVHDGAWQRSKDFCFLSAKMEEAAGKTMGLIGFGNIGQSVARIALALGMRVLVYVPHPKKGWDDVRFVSFDELISNSDILSLHCPLTAENRRMIGAQTLAKMKTGVRIINTARGPLVDERAMAEALAAGKVACYMADVLSEEPPKGDNPLLHAPNAILTPHVAWAPLQTRERLLKIVEDNVRAYAAGNPVNVVSR